MKNIKLVIGLIMISVSSMIFYSCHTETPFNVDHESPEIESLVIYSQTDTLYSYNYQDSIQPVFTDFNDTMRTEIYSYKFTISDNRSLYKVSLVAVDRFSKIEYEIKSILNPESNEFVINSSYKDYDIVQDSTFQEFNLKILAIDESENEGESDELGFYITKPSYLNLLYEEFGLLANTDNDPVDFREKIGKLAFIQFLAKG